MIDQQKLFEDIRVEAIAISASGLRLSAYADKLSESDNPICQYHAPKVKKAAGDAIIIRMVFCMRLFYPISGQSGTNKNACSRTDAPATVFFWTCIKIAKALREFDGEE
jgi:hypothetical protein